MNGPQVSSGMKRDSYLYCGCRCEAGSRGLVSPYTQGLRAVAFRGLDSTGMVVIAVVEVGEPYQSYSRMYVEVFQVGWQ